MRRYYREVRYGDLETYEHPQGEFVRFDDTEAQRKLMREAAEAARWVLNAFNNVSKAGGPTQDGEHEAALSALQEVYDNIKRLEEEGGR